MEKPKAFIAEGFSALDNLQEMLKTEPNLYDECISKQGFAFHFNQLANKAIHYDFIVKHILKDYENNAQ